MKRFSLLLALLSGCIFVITPEEQPSTKSSTSTSTSAKSEDVTFLSVSVTPTTGFVDGYELSVKLSVEVNVEMPSVAPHVEILAECKVGAQVSSDKDKAFFMSLSKARPGTQKEDLATLFRVQSLPQKPERCELTLQLDEGEGAPKKYCYQNETTKPGACAP